jgi:hypothetical protein
VVFSASSVISTEMVDGVILVMLRLKYHSDAANRILPATPVAGRCTQFSTMSSLTVSMRSCVVQFEILFLEDRQLSLLWRK